MAVASRTSRMVGRAADLARLDAELRAAMAGELRVVLVVGDPGVGKSRLAREFLARQSARTIGLPARAYPLGATAPFSLWIEGLERHLRTLGREAVRRRGGPYAGDLAALLPSVAAAYDQPPVGAQPPRARLLEGLTALLENLSVAKPVVIVFDDVHLADASSWEATSYVARNASRARALLLLTARPGELEQGHGGSEVLLALEQEGLLTRWTLGPLDPGEVRELAHAALPAGEAPSQRLIDWLVERSGGNPLFALGLLHALSDEGANTSAPRLAGVPEDLAERVRSRLRHLDADALDLLELLAALGRRVELGDLLRLSGWSLERVAPLVERLVRSRLVSEDERGREVSYEIVHPLIQETIYGLSTAAHRRLVHRRLARTLLAVGRLGEAAGHFARSAEPGDDEAIAALCEAVREAETREAYVEALAIVEALVELVPSSDERWLDVLDALAWDADWVVDHRADEDAAKGIRALREIDALLAPIGDPARSATVKFRLTSFLAWGTGELDEAEEACRQALELFERAGDRHRALVAANELAWIRGSLKGDLPYHEAEALRIAESAEREGDPFVAMQAHGAAAFASLTRANFGRAEAALQRSIAIARSEGKRYRLTWNLATLALERALAGRVEAAPALLEEAKAEDPAFRETILLEFQTAVSWLGGDLAAAIETAREIVARVGLSRRRASALPFAALAAADTGALPEARRLLAQAVRVYEPSDWMVFSHLCAHAEGVLAAREGDAAAATAALDAVASRLLAMDARAFAVFPLSDLAEIAAGNGDMDAADEAAERLADIARSGTDLHGALAAIASARARLARGDAEEAGRLASAAVDTLPAGYRVHEGQAQEVRGVALAAAGERAAAVQALEAAASVFVSCGALWRRDRVLEELRGLGHPGRKAAAAALGPESLTRREREVAQLAADGLTAREIGERLFIGERTVETHLAHAYAKLGVGSKLDLVRRAAELSL